MARKRQKCRAQHELGRTQRPAAFAFTSSSPLPKQQISSATPESSGPSPPPSGNTMRAAMALSVKSSFAANLTPVFLGPVKVASSW